MITKQDELLATVTANLMVILGDALDMSITMANECAERANKQIRHETRRYMKAAAHNVHMANQVLRQTSTSTQIGVGEDADILLALILLIIDRTTGSSANMTKLYEDIKKQYKSALGLPLDKTEDNAFGHCISDDNRSGETTDKA